jgi:hypothetical protein
MNKPKLIVYTTMSGQFSKANAEAMAKAGAILAFHIGKSEPKAIDFFMGYDVPDDQQIWITTAFDKTDTLESITQPTAFSNLMYRRKIPLAKVPGMIGIDFEPPGGALVRYAKEPLPFWAYANLRRQARDFFETFNFVLPVDARRSSLYKVFADVGIDKITEDSYFRSVGMDAVITLRLDGRMPIDCILSRMVSADGLGYGGKAAKFDDAMVGYKNERMLFIYATNSPSGTTAGNFGQIAKDIIRWLEVRP